MTKRGSMRATTFRSGQRVTITSVKGDSWRFAKTPGTVNSPAWACYIKFDSVPTKGYLKGEEGGGDVYTKPIRIGTRMRWLGRPGRVVKCQRVYMVELDQRCVDTGRILKYAIPTSKLTRTREPFKTRRQVG